MTKYLDINWLKANNQMIHFFGLGFVQLKLNDYQRMHFYHPSLEAFAEEPHDHRYPFISTVLKGALKNTIWKTRAEGGEEAELRYESCKKDEAQVPPTEKCRRYRVGEFITRKGSSYYMDEGLFHQVERVGSGPCITFLERPEPIKEFARVLAEPGAPSVCPFSKNLSEEELWQIVEDCLNA